MDRLLRFWDLTAQVWSEGVWGVDLGRLIEALAILIAFLLLRGLFSHYALSILRRQVERTKTDLDNQVMEVLEKPLRFVPVVLGVFFAIDHLALDGTYDQIGDNITRSLISFAFFWAFYRVVEPLSHLLTRLETVLTPVLLSWIVKAIKFLLIFIGAATILEIWGVKVAPILAGAGLFGVAVALGAQDLFKNLIAGILIIAERRFQFGDWVRVDGIVEGTVENIGFRSTMIRRFDKAPVYVPNMRFADNAVTNFSQMTNRRIHWMIGVEYGATVAQLRQIRDQIEAYVAEEDDFEKPPKVPTFVRIDRFGDSSIDIMLYCFTKTTDWGKWLEVKERLACNVKEIVEKAGTGFAFPSQSIYVETLPGERPEIFVPPGKP